MWDRLQGAVERFLDLNHTPLWVPPTLALLLSLVLGFVLSMVEVTEGHPLDSIVFAGSAADARGLLTVVVGTMITVTSLVFALTVVALQIASSQYSPRLLRTFLRDHGTQAVLSTFVGTVAYSLAGLHGVGAPTDDGTPFVPRLAISGSLVLALLSVGMLVYYIQHITNSIRIDTVMLTVERNTRQLILRDHPRLGVAPQPDPPDAPADALVVVATHSGYVQTGEMGSLVEDARGADLVVRQLPLVGYFVVPGQPLAKVWRHGGGEPDPRTAAVIVARGVRVFEERREELDVGLGLRQLVDIAQRAAAPSANDIYTAVQAVHHLTAVLVEGVDRDFSTRVLVDADGTPRAVVPIMNFETHLGVVCQHVRRGCADRHPRIAVELLRLLERVGTRAVTPRTRDECLRQLDLVVDDVRRNVAQPTDVEAVSEMAESIRAAVLAVAV